MPVVRIVAEPEGSLHGDGLGLAFFQEPGVPDGLRPFRFRPGPPIEGRQHLQGHAGLLELRARRGGLVGVFGLFVDGGARTGASTSSQRTPLLYR